MTPTAIASSAAASWRSAMPPAAVTSAPIPAAVMSAVVDSGPTESWRDEPSSA